MDIKTRVLAAVIAAAAVSGGAAFPDSGVEAAEME